MFFLNTVHKANIFDLNTNKIVALNHKNASFLLKFNKLVLKSKIV